MRDKGSDGKREMGGKINWDRNSVHGDRIIKIDRDREKETL